jgi:hypothetical protein
MKYFWRFCVAALILLNAPYNTVSADEKKLDISTVVEVFTVGQMIWEYYFLNQVIGQCGDKCIIRSNPGGYIYQFEDAAAIVTMRKIPVIIDGDCKSACAIFADTARPQVCITLKARFYFHLATQYAIFHVPSFITRLVGKEGGLEFSLAIKRFEPHQSPVVRKWIMASGGFPADGFLEMNNGAAQLFWPTCK